MELSVAIIFKNEIRCLERCLKSLQSLRERFSCEVVMADTGSTDGSREIAERYADVVFDFAWIDDFAAARNAVLERCSGKWVLTIDCDEWIETDGLDELVRFLHHKDAAKAHFASVIQRNYQTWDFDNYSDLFVPRLLNMAKHPRYEGSIHESPEFRESAVCYQLEHTILLHDGYVMLNDGSAAGREKVHRDLTLLRKELEKTPRDLRRNLEMMECAVYEPDYVEICRHALELVEQKAPLWEEYGPAILSKAVAAAEDGGLPELYSWAEEALRKFPNSYFTKIDVNYRLSRATYRHRRYEESVSHAKAFLRARVEASKDRAHAMELSVASFLHDSPFWDQWEYILLCDVYRELGRPDDALAALGETDASALSAQQLGSALGALQRLYLASDIDAGELLASLWQGACSAKIADQRQTFLTCGNASFRKDDPDNTAGEKYAWQMFRTLREDCVLGTAAKLMDCRDAEEADAALAKVTDWAMLPASALLHALQLGAEFPLPGSELAMELADTLAAGLREDKAFLREAAIFAAPAAETDSELIWARALAFAALQNNDWTTDQDAYTLLRAFVFTESKFLPRVFGDYALRHPSYLPPMHRLALHLANALSVIDPSAVYVDFNATIPPSVRAALDELRLAARTAPEYKAAVSVILDRLSDK